MGLEGKRKFIYGVYGATSNFVECDLTLDREVSYLSFPRLTTHRCIIASLR